MPLSLRWLAEPREAIEAPPLGVDLSCADAARALGQAADENILTLVVVGWSSAAWHLVRTEPRLRDRAVHWIVSARDRDALVAAAAEDEAEGEVVAAAVVELAEVAQVFAAVGGIFSLAVMSFDSDLLFRFEMMRVDNFVRQTRSLDRSLKDIRHLINRLDTRRDYCLVESWRGVCAGASALCVAAGPGLDQSVELLRRLAPACVVICVDVAYRKLSAAGIHCDYVLNVDSHDAAVMRMQGVPSVGTTLVMPIDGNAKADAWFPEIANFVPPSLAPILFGQVGPDFARGTNVGAATVGWALHLGCREIVLFGHDLSFPSEAAYSVFVPDHERHGKEMLAKVGRLAPVPGNGGVEVMTDHAFKIAAVDLAALVRSAGEAATVYNYNINLGRGALIERTLRLPEGWTPASAERRVPAAPQRRALVSGGELADQVAGHVRALHQRWLSERAVGTDVLTVIERIGEQSELGFAKDMLWPAVTGHVLHLVRLAALRTGEPSAAHVRAAERNTDILMERWAGYIQAQIAGAERPSPPLQLPPAGGHFLRSLVTHAPRLRQDSFEGALTPMLSRERISLRHHFPDLPLPMPPIAQEACHVLARIGGIAMPRDLVDLLCQCSLEGDLLHYVLDLAVEAGLLTGPTVRADSVVAWLRESAPDILEAHDALIAAMACGPCPGEDALRTIATWPPAMSSLIVSLLAGPLRPERVAALEQLVGEDAIPLDDAVVATIVALHPDPLQACTLLERRTSVTGPATALAIAKRLLDIGDLNGARSQFAGIGRIGRCAEDRLVIEGTWLVEHGRLDEFLETLGRWPNPEAGYRALWRILSGRIGAAQAVFALGGDSQAMLDPTVLGEVLAGLAARAEPLPSGLAPVMVRLLEVWSQRPRTTWDREQVVRFQQVLTRYLALGAGQPSA